MPPSTSNMKRWPIARAASISRAVWRRTAITIWIRSSGRLSRSMAASRGRAAARPTIGGRHRPGTSRPMLELWGGIECTVNRLGDRYVDQIALTGHDRRADDLARIARLGMRTLRYPVLWERVVRDGWSWCDDRLAELRHLKIRPIVGLLHHGSGPPDTDLLDAALPQGLAAHAAAVAARYPWVEDWTPVNEPLTTARFSGLYGLWYPHGRDDRSFVAMLLNQIGAIRAAMAAIRDIIPTARLLQTEDLGHTHATAPLAYQAAFENARRRLSLDLLTGRVGRRHPLRRGLTENAACSRLLDTWAAVPLPP